MNAITPAGQSELEARITTLEARLEIGQLPIRYAIAGDSRDVDSLVRLFEPSIRESLRSSYTVGLKEFYRSMHQVCGHRIELLTATTAKGISYCRAEHEVADRYIVAGLCYYDDYIKIDQEWLFVKREPRLWYSVDLLERPQDADFLSWTGSDAASLPAAFPTWKSFWDGYDTTSVTTRPESPVPTRLRSYGGTGAHAH
jgi:hypothetical protein